MKVPICQGAVMSEVSFSPIKNISTTTIRPASDASKLDPNSPNFFDALNKVFVKETSKLSPIAPGILVPRLDNPLS